MSIGSECQILQGASPTIGLDWVDSESLSSITKNQAYATSSSMLSACTITSGKYLDTDIKTSVLGSQGDFHVFRVPIINPQTKESQATCVRVVNQTSGERQLLKINEIVTEVLCLTLDGEKLLLVIDQHASIHVFCLENTNAASPRHSPVLSDSTHGLFKFASSSSIISSEANATKIVHLANDFLKSDPRFIKFFLNKTNTSQLFIFENNQVYLLDLRNLIYSNQRMIYYSACIMSSPAIMKQIRAPASMVSTDSLSAAKRRPKIFADAKFFCGFSDSTFFYLRKGKNAIYKADMDLDEKAKYIQARSTPHTFDIIDGPEFLHYFEGYGTLLVGCKRNTVLHLLLVDPSTGDLLDLIDSFQFDVSGVPQSDSLDSYTVAGLAGGSDPGTGSTAGFSQNLIFVPNTPGRFPTLAIYPRGYQILYSLTLFDGPNPNRVLLNDPQQFNASRHALHFYSIQSFTFHDRLLDLHYCASHENTTPKVDNTTGEFVYEKNNLHQFLAQFKKRMDRIYFETPIPAFKDTDQQQKQQLFLHPSQATDKPPQKPDNVLTETQEDIHRPVEEHAKNGFAEELPTPTKDTITEAHEQNEDAEKDLSGIVVKKADEDEQASLAADEQLVATNETLYGTDEPVVDRADVIENALDNHDLPETISKEKADSHVSETRSPENEAISPAQQNIPELKDFDILDLFRQKDSLTGEIAPAKRTLSSTSINNFASETPLSPSSTSDRSTEEILQPKAPRLDVSKPETPKADALKIAAPLIGDPVIDAPMMDTLQMETIDKSIVQSICDQPQQLPTESAELGLPHTVKLINPIKDKNIKMLKKPSSQQPTLNNGAHPQRKGSVQQQQQQQQQQSEAFDYTINNERPAASYLISARKNSTDLTSNLSPPAPVPASHKEKSFVKQEVWSPASSILPMSVKKNKHAQDKNEANASKTDPSSLIPVSGIQALLAAQQASVFSRFEKLFIRQEQNYTSLLDKKMDELAAKLKQDFSGVKHAMASENTQLKAKLDRLEDQNRALHDKITMLTSKSDSILSHQLMHAGASADHHKSSNAVVVPQENTETGFSLDTAAKKELNNLISKTISENLRSFETDLAEDLESRIVQQTADRIGATLTSEISRALPSVMAKSLEKIQFINTICANLQTAISEEVGSSFSLQFQAKLVPAFEAVAKKMYKSSALMVAETVNDAKENQANFSKELVGIVRHELAKLSK